MAPSQSLKDRPPSSTRQTLTDIAAGLLVGVISVLSAISLAGLIFSAELDVYLPIGIGLMLLSNLQIRSIVALGSSFPIAICNPQPEQVAILSVIAAGISTELTTADLPNAILPTVLVSTALASVLTGLLLMVLSPLKLDKYIRYLPYPIVGGFLAGIGLLLVQGGFKFMLRTSLNWSTVSPLILQFEQWLYWLPGAALAIGLVVVNRWLKQAWVIPTTLLGSIGLFYGLLSLLGLSLDEAKGLGLLLGPFPQNRFWQVLDLSHLNQIQWTVIGHQGGKVMTLMLLTTLSLLLNAIGLEVSTDREGNFQRELMTVGMANCVAGLTAGPAGSFSLKSSLLAFQMGGRGRLVGLSAAGVFAVTLLFGFSTLETMPRAIIGGLLIYLGLTLLIEWLGKAHDKMPRADYLTVLLIFSVMATAGLLQGIGVGLVIASLVFVLRYSQVATTRRILTGTNHRSNVERRSTQEKWLAQRGDQIHILELQGFIFFGTANNLLQLVRQRAQQTEPQPLKFVILDFRLVNGIDASAVVSFNRVRQFTEQKDIHLLWTAVNETIWQVLERGDCFDPTHLPNRWPDLDRGLEWCENELLAKLESVLTPTETSTLKLSKLFTNDEHIALFMQYLTKVSVAAGQSLFQQGDQSHSLYFIASGRLNILLERPDGLTQRIRSLGRGSVFGEMGLYTQSPRSASVIAEKASCLYQLDRNALKQMENKEPELANVLHTFVIRSLSARLDQFKQEASVLMIKPRELKTNTLDNALSNAEIDALADVSIIAEGPLETDTGDIGVALTADLAAKAAFPQYDETADSDLISGLVLSPSPSSPIAQEDALFQLEQQAEREIDDDSDAQTMFIKRCRKELSAIIGPLAEVFLDDILTQATYPDEQSLMNAVISQIPDPEKAALFAQNMQHNKPRPHSNPNL